jgi:membrane protein DedA with SNARE-associated domain
VTDLTALLVDLVEAYGPWALFVMAIAETSFVTGLVVPSGAAASVAAALSRDDPPTLVAIGASVVAGGWIGDMTGFWIGRRAGPTLLESRGWAGEILRKNEATVGRFLGRHPLYSVTLARLVSFVRTLMPLSAGMSGMRTRTYIPFEALGVVLWAGLYVGIGVLAGESWERVTSMVGTGWLVVFSVVGLVLWSRARGRRTAPAPAGSPVAPSAGSGSAGEAGAAAGGEPGSRGRDPVEPGPEAGEGVR